MDRRTFVSSSVVALATAMSRTLWASPEPQADSSRQSREDALAVLPLSKLNAATQRKIVDVVDHPSVYRRMPAKQIDCDPDLYLFLIRHPEVVVNIWKIMGVSNMRAERVAPFQWKGDDGAGTLCDVELCYGTQDMHLIYSEGFYEGPLFRKKMNAKCVLLLQSEYERGTDAKTYIGNRLDVFLLIENAGVDLIAKTLQPLVGSVADANFQETTKFLSKLSQTAERNGPGMQKLAERLEDVKPEVQAEFARVSAAVHARAASREGGVAQAQSQQRTR
nr:hypothetical protein [Pirellula staleyi]